jgi:hypothetical protein
VFAASDDDVDPCPGEQTCATDSLWPVAQGRHLAEYCVRGRCPHWPTKTEPGAMPAALPGEFVRLCREADKVATDVANGAVFHPEEHGVLVYDAYTARRAAERKVQNRPRDKNGKPILTPDDPAYTPDGPPGDGAGIDW